MSLDLKRGGMLVIITSSWEISNAYIKEHLIPKRQVLVLLTMEDAAKLRGWNLGAYDEVLMLGDDTRVRRFLRNLAELRRHGVAYGTVDYFNKEERDDPASGDEAG